MQPQLGYAWESARGRYRDLKGFPSHRSRRQRPVVEVRVHAIDVRAFHAKLRLPARKGREALPWHLTEQLDRMRNQVDVALQHIVARELVQLVGANAEVLERQARVRAHPRHSPDSEPKRGVAGQTGRKLCG